MKTGDHVVIAIDAQTLAKQCQLFPHHAEQLCQDKGLIIRAFVTQLLEDEACAIVQLSKPLLCGAWYVRTKTIPLRLLMLAPPPKLQQRWGYR